MIFKSNYGPVVIPEIPLHEEIFRRCHNYGDRNALICGATGRSYTYRQVGPLSKKVASGLVKLGVQKGNVIALILPNLPEFVFCVLGTMAAGAAATTINPSYTANEINKQLVDSEAVVLITAKGLEKTVDAALGKEQTNIKHKILLGGTSDGFIPFTQFMNDDGSAYPHNMKFNVKEDLALIPYSSGTTGLPKGVMVTHYNIVANLYQGTLEGYVDPTVHRFHETLHETTLCIIPMFHAMGLLIIVIGGLRSGNSIVSLPRFEPEMFLSAIEKYKISILSLVPPLVVFMTKSPLVKKYDFSSIKKAGSGAAPLSAEVVQEFIKLVGVPHMGQGYGMTEAAPAITGPSYKKYVPGSSGVVYPGTEIKIVDLSSGKELGIGERGEIWFRGPQVMKGYFKNPEATANTIDKEGWLHTGDVGYFDEDENIFVVGRIKELIKYKAFQVAPAELEALLLTYKGISDAAVVGIPDKEAGEIPRAYLVQNEGYNITEKEIHEFMKENAASFKQLRGGVEFIEAIPKTPSGKILRNALVERHIKSKL